MPVLPVAWHPSSRGITAFAAMLATLVFADVAALNAQTVRGRLLESNTQRAIMLGSVALLDTTMTVVDETFTDENGSFVLRARQPGAYWVLAQRDGYRRTLDGILELGTAGDITVDFFLRSLAIPLDSITVEVRRERLVEHLRAAGFYERRAEGMAWFLGPEELEKIVTTDAANLFRSAPLARIIELGPTTSLVFRGGSIMSGSENGLYGKRPEDPLGSCTPRVLVDGTLAATAVTGIPGALIDDAVNPLDIAAIEVHSGPASLPLIWGGTSTSCTTIIIWTRSGAGR